MIYILKLINIIKGININGFNINIKIISRYSIIVL